MSEAFTKYRLRTGSRDVNWQEPWGLRVADNMIEAYTRFDKFGLNEDIDTISVPEDIWEFGGTYTFPANETAPIDSISSSSASDTIEIKIAGLDINGFPVEQTIVLQGQTKVTLDTALWRVNRAYNDSSTDMVGNIYIYEDTAISSGVPIDSSKVKAYISTDRQQTEQCIYTVPEDHFLFLDSIWSGISNKIAASVIISLHVREYGKVFRDRGTWAASSTGTGMFQIEFCQPRRYGPRTDIKLICEDTTANNVGVFGMFDGDLRDERVAYR